MLSLRRVAIFFALAVLTSGAQGQAPLIHYTFNGNALDVSGNGYNGIVTGSPQYVPGPNGLAIYFDNPIGGVQATQFVAVPDLSAFNNQSFTIALLMQSTDTAQTSGRLFGNNFLSPGVTFDYNRGASANANLAFGDMGGLHILFDNSVGAEGRVTDGLWHWMVLVIDRQNNLASGYIDGAMQQLDITSMGALALANLLIGSCNDASQGQTYAARLTAVGDFQFYNTALTSDQVVALESSLVLTPNVLTGGLSGTGTVNLSSAPTSDTTVALASSDPTVAAVPATVTIPAGQTTVSFTVTTSAVKLNTPVTLSATFNNLTKQAALLVTPSRLASVKLSPASVIGSKNAKGTVILSATAPTGGFVVGLGSSNSAIASVPASVTVPAGGKTVTFTITTTAVATVSTAAITATFGGAAKSATLTIQPANLVAVTLSPNAVTGGATSTATVTLNGQAPAGGAQVALSSSMPAVASVPATITVPAGATRVSFTITTVPVTADTTVGIHALYNDTEKAAVLSVKAAVIHSLSLKPTTVKGGAKNSTATITLTGAAPTGGLMVTLASSDTDAATVPATVTVPAGSKVTTFPVTSLAVTATRHLVISATTGTFSKTAPLTVTP